MVRLLRGAALAAALVAGLLLGRRSHEHSEVREETVSSAKTGDCTVARSQSPESGLFAKLDSLESRADYETLLQELQALPLAERDFAIEMLFLRWARTDPEGAIAAAEREHDPNLWLKSIYRDWGAYDLMAALESLGARKKDHHVSSIVSNMRDHVTSENVDKVFEFMRERSWRYLWEAVWREMDVDDAKARFLTLSPDVYYGAVPGLATRLAEQDVDGALGWASSLNRGNRSAVDAIVKVVERNGAAKRAYEISKAHGGATLSPETVIALAEGIRRRSRAFACGVGLLWHGVDGTCVL